MIDNYIFQTYLPLISDLLCFIVWLSIPSKILPPIKKRKWIFYMTIGVNMVYSFVCRSIPALLTSPLKLPIMLFTFLVYIFLCYKETIAQKLIVFSLWILSFTLADMAAVVIMSLLNLSLTEPIGGLPVHFVSGSITALTSYIFGIVAGFAYNKVRRKSVAATRMWQFQVVVISQFLFIMTIGYCTYSNNYTIDNMVLRNPATTVLLLLTIIVAVFADIFLYRILLANSQNYRLKQEIEIMKTKDKLELEYYEKLQKNVNETRKLNHDFSNAISVIEEIINTPEIPENKKLALNMLEDIKENLKKTKVRHYCENELVNLVVINKTQKLLDEGVDFSANLNIPDQIAINNLDLCRILTNILDNAIEASLSTKNREKAFVVLTAAYIDNTLTLTCENYSDSEIIRKSGKLVSSKPSHKGLGLQVIDEIAKTYSGKAKIDINNKIFTIEVSLKTT